MIIGGVQLLLGGVAAPPEPLRLLGDDTFNGTVQYGAGQNYALCFQFTALATGVASEARYTNSFNYNLGSVAIYTDNGADRPSTRISTSAVGWHNDIATTPLPISPVTLTEGTKYWVAFGSGHGLYYVNGRSPVLDGIFSWPVNNTLLPATAPALISMNILGIPPDIAIYQV